MEKKYELKINFYRERILSQLLEMRDGLGEFRYNLYANTIKECDNLDDLKEFAELELQSNMMKYSQELKRKLDEIGTNVKELKQVLEPSEAYVKNDDDIIEENSLISELYKDDQVADAQLLALLLADTMKKQQAEPILPDDGDEYEGYIEDEDDGGSEFDIDLNGYDLDGSGDEYDNEYAEYDTDNSITYSTEPNEALYSSNSGYETVDEYEEEEVGEYGEDYFNTLGESDDDEDYLLGLSEEDEDTEEEVLDSDDYIEEQNEAFASSSDEFEFNLGEDENSLTDEEYADATEEGINLDLDSLVDDEDYIEEYAEDVEEETVETSDSLDFSKVYEEDFYDIEETAEEKPYAFKQTEFNFAQTKAVSENKNSSANKSQQVNRPVATSGRKNEPTQIFKDGTARGDKTQKTLNVINGFINLTAHGAKRVANKAIKRIEVIATDNDDEEVDF